jgi:hypothetical protein
MTLLVALAVTAVMLMISTAAPAFADGNGGNGCGLGTVVSATSHEAREDFGKGVGFLNDIGFNPGQTLQLNHELSKAACHAS